MTYIQLYDMPLYEISIFSSKSRNLEHNPIDLIYDKITIDRTYYTSLAGCDLVPPGVKKLSDSSRLALELACVYDLSNIKWSKSKNQDLMEFYSNRNFKIFRLYFGMEDGRRRSLAEIGKIFDLSGPRIRDVVNRSLRRLRCQNSITAITVKKIELVENDE